jgi:geranylgeranyl diphosphate synthase, type I
MALIDFVKQMQPAVENELKSVLAMAKGSGLEEFHYMLAYHLGWEGEGAGPEARGKRLRPLLLLLTTAAAGADWQHALPSAAAIELIHNFSLIHDDIEDNSPLRRGRPTLWARWGIPQAINAGDAMFSLAHLAIFRLAETVSSQVAFQASRILQETCLHLTQGQYLDISYEARGDLTLEAYWPMVGGKTAALLAACCHIGALAAEAEPNICASYRQFGWYLGLAFQALDDLLGIWGESAATGKSTESDLLSGKKSLPVLYGLRKKGPFAHRWAKGLISVEEVADIAHQLELEGARDYTIDRADELTQQAIKALDQAQPQGEAGEALRALAMALLDRQS